MRVFVDGSAIEIYINDVFVLTTRGYYWYEDSTRIGFVYQVPHSNSSSQSEQGVEVKFSNTTWWEGLIDAYPNRPKDKQQLINQAIGYLSRATIRMRRESSIRYRSKSAFPQPRIGSATITHVSHNASAH